MAQTARPMGRHRHESRRPDGWRRRGRRERAVVSDRRGRGRRGQPGGSRHGPGCARSATACPAGHARLGLPWSARGAARRLSRPGAHDDRLVRLQHGDRRLRAGAPDRSAPPRRHGHLRGRDARGRMARAERPVVDGAGGRPGHGRTCRGRAPACPRRTRGSASGRRRARHVAGAAAGDCRDGGLWRGVRPADA
jgi:hypothetical protein